MLSRLDERAVQRISGPAWRPIRGVFLEISDHLLAVSPEAIARLTTIYVKYLPSPSSSGVYAVVWLKTSKRIVVGLALPDDVDAPLLDLPPKGMTYKGLTKYFSLTADDLVPKELPTWAKIAHDVVVRCD